MKISQLRAKTDTTFKPLDSDGDELGITIYAKTFASKEWRDAKKKNNVDDALYISEGNKVEIGAPLEENELKAVADLVTNIKGLDDWTYSAKAVNEIFLDPAIASIPQQLHTHLKTLGNGIKVSKKK